MSRTLATHAASQSRLRGNLNESFCHASRHHQRLLRLTIVGIVDGLPGPRVLDFQGLEEAHTEIPALARGQRHCEPKKLFFGYVHASNA